LTTRASNGAAPQRWLLWDIDGTLVRFVGAASDKHSIAVESVLGHAVGQDLRTAGMTDREIVIAIFDAQGFDATTAHVDAALAVLEELSEREMTAESLRALDGVKETLADSAAIGWTNGLLTGNTPKRARTKLTAAGLWFLVESGGGFFGDRHCDRFSLAAEGRAARAAASQCVIVIVGDTPLDIQAGQAAGLFVVAVATGKFSLEDLEPFEPDLLIPDLVSGRHALMEFLARLG